MDEAIITASSKCIATVVLKLCTFRNKNSDNARSYPFSQIRSHLCKLTHGFLEGIIPSTTQPAIDINSADNYASQ